MNHSNAIESTARGSVYRFAALGFAPPEPSVLFQLRGQLHLLETSLEVLRDRDSLELAERIRAVFERIAIDDLKASHLHCFGHTISKECPPYESEYNQTHIFEKSQSLADIAGFYKAFGLNLAPDLNDRLDHISVELEFMQFLCLKEAYAVAEHHDQEKLALCRDAQLKFLDEHLGCWAFGFVRRLKNRSGDGLHGLIGEMLVAFLTGEMRRFGLEPGGEVELALQETPEEEIAGCHTCTFAGVPGGFEQGESP
jgi:DMSO reductase family type II enzyme chaperone